MKWQSLLLAAVSVLAKKPLWPPIPVNGPNNSTQPRLNAMSYDGNCMGCIVNGYQYCSDFQTCLDLSSNCPRGINFTMATGCPIVAPCNFGFEGIGYLGEDSYLSYSRGGVPSKGSYLFVAPQHRPCYVSLVNNNGARLQYQVTGHDL